MACAAGCVWGGGALQPTPELIDWWSPAPEPAAAREPEECFWGCSACQRQRRGLADRSTEIQAGPRRLGLHGQRLASRTARSLEGRGPRRAPSARVGLLGPRALLPSPCQRAACRPRPAAIFRWCWAPAVALGYAWATEAPARLPGWRSLVARAFCCRHCGYLTRAASTWQLTAVHALSDASSTRPELKR